MIVYEGTKGEYQALGDGRALAVAIARKMGRDPDPGNTEFHSWESSFTPVSRLLNHAAIPNDICVAIEYGLQIGNFRIDYFFTGLDADEKPVGVIVELKQWTFKNVRIHDAAPQLLSVKGYGSQALVHPSYQAWSYAALLENYDANVQDIPITLSPCSYLFNYLPDGDDVLRNHEFDEILQKAPLYDYSGENDLKDFLAKTLRFGDGRFEIIHRIDESEIRPSKALQNAVGDMLEGNQAFLLVDDQERVFRKAYSMVLKGLVDTKRRVYIVHGGPGTGKSVIAVNLMARLLTDGIPTEHFRHDAGRPALSHIRHQTALYCPYVTKTSAPRNVYEALLARHSQTGKKWTKKELEGLFLGAGKFRRMEERPTYAGLIVDEAHRFMEKDRFSHGMNYLECVMSSAYTTIFFIDDKQRVSTADYGTSEAILALAKKFGADVEEDTLKTEFRCLGGNAYISWVDGLLYGNEKRSFAGDYDFRVFDDVTKMHQAIIEKDGEANASLPSRVVAGYCWDWISKKNSALHDIVIDQKGHPRYAHTWNLSSKTPFAIGESQQEVGCIHTVQGLEFSYVGVIIGNDLQYRDGEIVTDRRARAKTDNTLDDLKTVGKAEVDEIIRNTYRVLLTRGQKGCFVYCCDPALGSYLKSLTASAFVADAAYGTALAAENDLI